MIDCLKMSFQLANLLAEYITANKQRLIDTRNSKIVLCQGDLLGNALNVKAFHRTQATMTSDWSAACHFTKHQMILHRFGGASIYKSFSGAAAANLTLL